MAAAVSAVPVPVPVPVASPPLAPLASLYVCDLQEDVTEENLKFLFKNYDGIVSVKVCRDSLSNKSLGYAYVNFLQAEEAEKAMERLRYTVFHGRPIRIAWSNRDPLLRKSGIGNIFIKNLDASIDHAKLHSIFQVFGKIVSCKVAMENGKSMGHGYVQFDSEKCAADAIEKMDGQIVEGKEISVKPFIRREERKGTPAEQKFTNLYLKNIDNEITEEKLHFIFAEVGKVSNVAIMKDENGVPKGFGFVNYENHQDAVAAIEKFNGLELGSKRLYVGRAQKKSERRQLLRQEYLQRREELLLKYQKSNLYVKNLHDTIDEDELRKLFESFGNITSAVVMRDQRSKGVSRGFGFVCFSNSEEANKALNSLNGYLYKSKRLYVNYAQPKEVRRLQLAIRFASQIQPVSPVGTLFGHNTGIYYPSHTGMLSSMPQGVMYQGELNPRMNPRPSGWNYLSSIRKSYQGTFPTTPAALLPPSTPRFRHQKPQFMMHQNHRVPYFRQSSEPTHYQSYGRFMNASNSSSEIIQYESNSSAQSNDSDSMDNLTSRLAKASPFEQKNLLGTKLLPLISQRQPQLAQKITGMLLEMDNSELLNLLESPDSLDSRVNEAVQVLKNSEHIVTKSSV